MNRKTFAAKTGAALLTASLLATSIPLGATAASVQRVTALLRPETSIVVDGSARTFYNVSGQEVHPILYNGTTYLPLRSIGELMDKNVDWNQSTLTVTIGGARTTADVTGTPDATAKESNVTAELRPDFTIVVDGTVRTFQDVNGNTVYPMLYNGSTYLPVHPDSDTVQRQPGLRCRQLWQRFQRPAERQPRQLQWHQCKLDLCRDCKEQGPGPCRPVCQRCHLPPLPSGVG